MPETAMPNQTSLQPDSPYANVMQTMTELDTLRGNSSQTERKLKQALTELCGRLGTEVQKHQPALKVGLNNGKCVISYLDKAIELSPDMASRQWNVSSGNQRFGSRFKRDCQQFCSMDVPLDQLARAASEFFTSWYKSIPRDGQVVLAEDGSLPSDNFQFLFEEMAAEHQPQDGLAALDNAMRATGLHQALAKGGIYNRLSRDRQSIIFYCHAQGDQIRPLAAYPLIDMAKTKELEEALDALADIAKNQAPGAGRAERELIKQREQMLRATAQQFAPQQPKPQKPITPIFANV